MEVEVNWLAVGLATLASMVVGSIWYMPQVFGNTWMKLAKVDPKEAGKRGWTPIIVAIALSFVTAYVLAHVSYLSNQFFGNSFLQDALTTAFWLWLGFTAARIAVHDAFEGRPLKLTAMNAAHELATFMAMAAIIGLLDI